MIVRRWVDSAKKITIKQLMLVILGAFFSAFAVKTFVRPANLVPSGINGLAILMIREVQTFFHVEWSYGIVYFLLNLAVLIFVYKGLGKRFLLLSFVHVIFVSIFVEAVPTFHLVNDLILLAVFGGFINAIGSLLALYAGASTGGTDFIAIYYSSKKNKPMWNHILVFNIALLLYYGFRYEWTLALYSMIFQIISLQTINAYYNRYKLASIKIICDESKPITDAIFKVARHGITRERGLGIYQNRPREVLYMVVNRFEVELIVSTVLEADPKAFVEVSKVDEVYGNYRQKPLD